MPKTMQKRHRIDYDSVTISKNALGIWYESRTIFRIGEFVAKVLNSSKLLSRIPDRPTNCKNSLRTMRISLDHHELSTIQPRIQIFVNSCQFVVWNRGIRHNCESSRMHHYTRRQEVNKTFHMCILFAFT